MRPRPPSSSASTRVDSDDKRAAVLKLIRDRSLTQALVFVNSKLGCARLARSFERDGLRTTALHGDKSQDERLKALDAFKAGSVDVMVATDVAARGLDIADLPAVFNFDVPFNAEDYVHRIGRTGRAGASGLAVTLVTRDDARLMADIEKLIKKKVELEALELDEAPPRREPRERGAARRRGGAARAGACGSRASGGAAAARAARPVLRPALRRGESMPARAGSRSAASAGGARAVAEHQAEEEGGGAVRRQAGRIKPRPAVRRPPARRPAGRSGIVAPGRDAAAAREAAVQRQPAADRQAASTAAAWPAARRAAPGCGRASRSSAGSGWARRDRASSSRMRALRAAGSIGR